MEPGQEFPWVLLVYKVPREPTALRALVWRRLKRLGALLLHDAAWVLPATAWTREQMQWLAVEIEELGGEALLWEAQALLPRQQEALRQQFLERVDALYRAMQAELARADADLIALSRRYQQARALDYFHSPLGVQVRDQLLAARGGGNT
jgi:hypothetical protein